LRGAQRRVRDPQRCIIITAGQQQAGDQVY
jgi:hypothetical protein